MNCFKNIVALCGLMCLSTTATVGQLKINYSLETAAALATGDHTPFWQVNHTWGVQSLASNNVYLRQGAFVEQQINRDWSWSAGLDFVAASVSTYGKSWIQQLYLHANWKIIGVEIGSRENYLSLFNPDLSSGDLAKSNNARPIPVIKAGFPDYVLIPFTKGNLFIKGEVGYGKYLDTDYLAQQAIPFHRNYVGGIYAHNKAIFFRFGDIEHRHRQQFTLSCTNDAQWGGIIYKANPDGSYDVLPQSKNLIDGAVRITLGVGGGETPQDQSFIFGSSWGSYSLKYDRLIGNRGRQISAYLNHFFEDGSGMGFINLPDNLYGLEYTGVAGEWISAVVAEVLYTKHQSGATMNNALGREGSYTPPSSDNKYRTDGSDNYYNNGDYCNGVSHFGKPLGNPLLLAPEYNTDGYIGFAGNRVMALHLAIEGYLQAEWQYRLLFSTGRNWGTFYIPFSQIKSGWATGATIMYNPKKIAGLSMQIAVACDEGDFFGGNTLGGKFTIIKKGIISQWN
ncbi:MAG: capsule assembly Wzi family protein [Candidatus Symbiothrix sp.]|nr:capsule assembly Wzi family protein [Candidatus Symbiothrix sp.]